MSRRPVQTVRGAVLFVMAALFAVVSFEALSKLWAAYQDSPWWVYAVYGGISGVLAVVCSLLGVRSLRHR
jgi:uncharacterized membrane protein YdcZ (DUF606 family)